MTIGKLAAWTAALALTAAAPPALARNAPQDAAAPSAPTQARLPLLAGAQPAQDCGGLNLGAVCVRTTIAQLQPVFDAYEAFFEQQGWVTIAAIENGVVLAASREGGGCDGMQIVAFVNEALGTAPESPGFLALARMTGDLCPGANAPTPAQ